MSKFIPLEPNRWAIGLLGKAISRYHVGVRDPGDECPLMRTIRPNSLSAVPHRRENEISGFQLKLRHCYIEENEYIILVIYEF